jgi:hypothetical protein
MRSPECILENVAGEIRATRKLILSPSPLGGNVVPGSDSHSNLPEPRFWIVSESLTTQELRQTSIK